MKVLAWNLQRLGAATDPAHVGTINNVVKSVEPDLVLYTELTTACPDPTPFNPTYRRENPAQLCYGGFRPQGGPVGFKQITPESTPYYQQLGYGQNVFSTLVNRAPALVTPGDGNDLWDGVMLVLLHAPASNAAVQALLFLGCWLESLPCDYVLVGDLNADPRAIDEIVTGKHASVLKNRRRFTLSSTHQSGGRLDYVFARLDGGKGKGVTVSRALSGAAFSASDHFPIVVEW